MASPTLTLINDGSLTDGVLSDADANTGWSNLTTPDTDIKVEGTGSMSGITRSDGEDSYYDAAGAPVTAVGKVLRGWVNTTNIPYMQPEATNPYELWCYDSSSQSNGLALFGSDTYPGGWFYYWQDMDDFTGVTLANVDRWGIEAGHSGNAKNIINMWMDVLRYMDGYYLTGGTSGDEVTFTTLSATDSTSAYGIVQNNFNVFFCTGEVQIGNGATTTYFESDGEVIVFLDTPGALSISAGLYEINVQGSGCNCTIKNSVLRANGTGDTTRFILDFSDTDATLTFTDNLITRASTITFASGQSPTGNIFDDCGQITHGGADMTDCVVKNYEGTAGTAAVLYNINVDPDGEMDNMIFTKGTASTHAIEFGTSTPTTITLRGIDFSGYNASHEQNDSTLRFLHTSGTVTVNLIDCSGNISYKKEAGATIALVIAPRVLTLSEMVENSEVTITERGTAVDTGSDGSSTADSRNFVTTNTWTIDAYKGHLLYIDSGADAGRYYVSGNSATTLYLDAELSATAGSLTWRLFDENDDVIEHHTENVVASGIDTFSYTYASSYIVDILVIHVNYEAIVFEDYTLLDANTTLPAKQTEDLNYYNPV